MYLHLNDETVQFFVCFQECVWSHSKRMEWLRSKMIQLATGTSRLSITRMLKSLGSSPSFLSCIFLCTTQGNILIRERCNVILSESRSSVWIYWWRTCLIRFARYKRLSSTAKMQYSLSYQLIVRKHFLDEILRLSTSMSRNTQAKPYTNGRVAIARSSNFAVS